eukprot:Blabericola_migrator_1__1418@NODE_1371_length_4701_cov_185_446051_g920_i0_p1_GENE_NODE_1371_length_4701_cov_185_446051_g920_i0NODE_1371_length_4701_cov_185_446051_g920_i0_p1_ORF_typecomplete_len354_score30_31_NODE_1371_length_4701_cov_185_446051_g920_i018882949
MSGARYLPRAGEARAVAPSKFLVLTVLTLEPTLAVKGDSSCFIACCGKGEQRTDRVRWSRRALRRKEQPGDMAQGASSEVSGDDSGFHSCELRCEELQYLIKGLEASSRLPSHLRPLVDHFKEMFLNSCGLSATVGDKGGPATEWAKTTPDTPWFIGRISLPDAFVGMLKEHCIAIRGHGITDLEKETVRYHLSELGLKKWLSDISSHIEIAKALWKVVEGNEEPTEFELLAGEVDAQLNSRYLQLFTTSLEGAQTSGSSDASLSSQDRLSIFGTTSRWSYKAQHGFARTKFAIQSPFEPLQSLDCDRKSASASSIESSTLSNSSSSSNYASCDSTTSAEHSFADSKVESTAV